jgi:hypothetical protein
MVLLVFTACVLRGMFACVAVVGSVLVARFPAAIGLGNRADCGVLTDEPARRGLDGARVQRVPIRDIL